MSKYVLFNGGFNDINALCHYGVLGMRWGVRRGKYSQTFAKAARKADKLTKKTYKLARKAAKATDPEKASKLYKKQIRMEKKTQRWINEMHNEFSRVSVNSISPKYLRKGRNYVYMLSTQTLDYTVDLTKR